jgi:O-antigen/teichoic acid export membrane protein
MYRRTFKGVHILFDKNLIIQLIKTGWPLLVNGLVWMVMVSIDKFVILGTMTMEDMGHYSIGNFGFSTLVLIPQALSQVYYVKMSTYYGAQRDVFSLVEAASRFSRTISAVTCLTAVGALTLLPPFVSWLMPKYIPGVPAAQIMIVGVALYSTSMIYSNIFSILKKNGELLGNTILICILNAVFSLGLVYIFGKDIRMVAAGTSVAYALYSLSIMITLKRTLHIEIFKLFVQSWVPLMITIIPCILILILVQNQILSICLAALCTIISMVAIYYKNIIQLIRKYKDDGIFKNR